ncbi:EAL domain-containing protein [Vibrio sp. ES.051]|uniref:EAL domain-containing protein n=1 Tax=Vibrio sp. ES.051 TaxID=1761909 RepID=UPI000BF2FB6A|nr:EAL domain-containing protein [Vibrio sp. ES.051]
MFHFAIPSPLLADWQHALRQCCDATQAQGQLYTLSNSQQWRSTEVSTTKQTHHAIVAVIEQIAAQFTPLSFEVISKPFEAQALSVAPVWLPNGELFAVFTLTHSNAQATVVSAWLSALAGRVSFDVSSHYYQQAPKHHPTATTTPLPTLQEFINCLDDHIWIKGVDGLYLMTNRSVEQAWQKTNHEIIGTDDFALFNQERAEKFIDADKLVMATGSQKIVEECRKSDEHTRPTWLETIKSPIHDHAGNVIGILGMTRNITRRKMVETQLSLASRIFNNSQEGMVITDRNANIIDVNPAFTHITGYSSEEVMGKNPSLLRSGHHDDSFYQQLWHQLKTKGQWKGEFINRKKDDSIYPQLATISAVMDDKNQLINYICVFEDISVRKAHEEKLQRMAFYDPLTNLPNRPHLIRLLEQHIDMGQEFVTLFLDIDHFKHINDSMGHFCGDQLLSKLAIRLQNILQVNAHVARIGGDEFVIILPSTSSDMALLETVGNILAVFQQPFDLVHHDSLRVSTSVGIALYPRDGQDSETLLKNADTAMYLAKKNGRNGYAFYSPDLTDKSVSHVRIQSALHQAIEKQQLHLEFQPQYHVEQNVMMGVEVLLRWHHPEFGPVSPSDFIPIAEKTGLIQSIGEWVLKQACLQGNAWLERGIEFGRIAVNVSALQLQQSNFIHRLRTILDETGFPAQRLDLEITESFLLIDPKHAITSLNQLRDLGIEISLDDFGTGYSSLSYLKGLPINKLKIDSSFVSDVPSHNDSNAIVNAIIAMGKTLSLKIVAEGIETQEQADYLSDNGCIYGQGFLFSRPVTADKLFH